MDALDKRTFEMWVREITTRLDRQDKLIAMLARKEYEKDNSDVMEIPLVDGERLLDNQDLCMLLQFSKRSLQRYRSMKALPYIKIGKKSYYKVSDVREFIKEHGEIFRKGDAVFYETCLHKGFCHKNVINLWQITRSTRSEKGTARLQYSENKDDLIAFSKSAR